MACRPSHRWWLIAGVAGLACSLWVRAAPAQSAADTATARNLATEGIELYQEQRYAEALDRLERAQALYDAPVHLLYIARSQAGLGRVVEASETYRRLLRVELAPDAPDAFKNAQQAAQSEVAEAEARIAGLRIEVAPEGLEGLTLSIDGHPLPPAVLGVERPVNPGRHVVSASATGYAGSEQEVELGAGEKQELRLELVPATPAKASSKAAGTAAPPVKQAEPARRKDFELLAGLRLGAAFPSGTLREASGDQLDAADYFGPGAAVELYAGARMLRHFGAKLFVEGYGFSNGPELEDQNAVDPSLDVEHTASGQGVGLAAMYGTESGKWGGFGELGFVFRRQLNLESRYDPVLSGSSCDVAIHLSGPALRLGGGAHVPISRWLQLLPFAQVSIGQVTRVEVDGSCSDDSTSFSGEDIPEDERGSTQLFVLGVGGELFFGLR